MYKAKIERIRGENRYSVILVGDYNSGCQELGKGRMRVLFNYNKFSVLQDKKSSGDGQW